MKIIQLNCWAGHLIHPLLNFIGEEQPDILCAQEVLNTQDGSNNLFYSYQSLDHIKRTGQFGYTIYAASWATDSFGQKVEFGNAIFSKLPLKDTQIKYIDSQFNYPQNAKGFIRNIRTLIYAQVDCEKSFVIANHHGYHDLNPLGNEESIKSSQAVVAELKKINGPLVFCGDLNVVKESPAFEPYNSLGLRDLTTENHIASTLSSIHEAPNKNRVACDYIFCSPELKEKSFTVSNEVVSDHKALIVELEL